MLSSAASRFSRSLARTRVLPTSSSTLLQLRSLFIQTEDTPNGPAIKSRVQGAAKWIQGTTYSKDSAKSQIVALESAKATLGAENKELRETIASMKATALQKELLTERALDDATSSEESANFQIIALEAHLAEALSEVKTLHAAIEASAAKETTRQLNESALAEEAHDDEQEEELSQKRPAKANSNESSSKKKSKRGQQVPWEQHYEELKKYKQANGDCLVTRTYAANPKLGTWVKNQRRGYQLYMKAKEAAIPTNSCMGMTEERISLLNGLGFSWTAKVSPVPWNQRYEELKEYKEEHGDCLVPQMYATNKQLGRWVAKQRTGYQQYMKAKEAGELATTACHGMTKERITLLEEIGFCWSARLGSNKRKDGI